MTDGATIAIREWVQAQRPLSTFAGISQVAA